MRKSPSHGRGSESKGTIMPGPFPPGPSDWFLGMGQIRQISADPLAYYQRLQRTYGDCVYMRFGPFRDYVFFHPEQIRELLVTRNKSFRKFTRVRDAFAAV